MGDFRPGQMVNLTFLYSSSSSYLVRQASCTFHDQEGHATTLGSCEINSCFNELKQDGCLAYTTRLSGFFLIPCYSQDGCKRNQ